MKIPRYIRKNNRIYEFEKIYPSYIMYKDKEIGIKECFHRQELGLIKSINIMRGFKLSPDNVKI